MAQCKAETAWIYTRELASGQNYEGNKRLGNVQPGDGPKFKGRGWIQLTGRDVYRKMTGYFKGPDFESQPELVEQQEWASKAVLYFFNQYKPKGFKNGLMSQPYQDSDTFWGDVDSVSALVNGGTNGLEKRRQYFSEYKAKFQSDGIVPKGVVGTGSGGVLKDGSGNPVKSGA